MLSSQHLSDVPGQIEPLVRDLAIRAKAASVTLGNATAEKKNAVLGRVAEELMGPLRAEILQANVADVRDGAAAGLASAMQDRLTLTAARLDAVVAAVRYVMELPDPVGTMTDAKVLPNGLSVGRMRVPLGLIAIIYEARPNVTVDAAALCVKSGNGVILRGGKESFRTNQVLAKAFERALVAEGFSKDAVLLLPTTDRAATTALIRLSGIVDLAIPRGGESLIRFVSENATVPVIQHYKGVCHVYVDGEADFDMALRIVENSKVHRPGVCNALETLLVDRACAAAFVPKVVAQLEAKGVEIRGDAAIREVAPKVAAATAADWDTEYLSLILSVAMVDGIEGALQHVAKHGSHHTEAIVTSNSAKAERWLREVDASAVMVNASTRFNDGGELGLGAEIGISTSKMHAYGPMGLEELCARKWVVRGDGQVRGG